ncbi:MAG: hypothetical protein KDC18_19165 [Alphaproteobacteria bacterium]|nr:hypothetical protein [Alphaproteobacteria bacterium]MCB9931564.1 hypothetical protein [Alphaproteobacteria bacterium]
MSRPPDRTDALARALDYPYAAPAGSYLFRDGRALPYRPPGRGAHGRRVPVIGYGSNRAPEQLARKYPGAAEIPVEAAWLEGFDAVHAARLSGYGAVPATLAPCPGMRVAVSVAWLTLAQLPAMHRSEAIGVGYDFGVLEAPLLGEHSGRLPRALVYVARSGAFAPAGEPVALAGIRAEGRRWRALAQAEMQEYLRAALAPDQPLERFVLDHADNRAVRQQRAAWLAKTAQPWHEPRFRVLAACDPL